MKATSLFLLPAAVSAAVLNTRQFGINSMGGAKVEKITKLTPEIRPDAIRQITRFGPYKLKGKTAQSTDSGQQNFLLTVRDGFCKDCTVLKGHVGLQFKDGTPAVVSKGVYIHHILNFDMTKKQKAFVESCSEGGLSSLGASIGSKFVGTGDDQANIPVWYTTRDGKHGGGFFIGPKDTFMMNADLVNYNAEEKEVFITMELEYLNGQIGSDTRDTLLSVTGCGNPTINIDPTGPTNTTSGKYTFVEDGKIIFAKGHLHDGGDKMVLNINDEFICESQAKYGTSAHATLEQADGTKKESISEMSICSEKPIDVKKGDVLTMTAVYDASKHPVRHESHGMGGGMGGMPDVMGMWAIAFSAPVAQ